MNIIRKSALVSIFAGVINSTFVLAQGDFDKVEIVSHKVSDSIYMLEGRGGNIGVFTGPDGVIMIDDQFAALTDKIVAAVKQISNRQIRFLINTHIHRDHVGGNENLAKQGVLIYAHDNVRKRLIDSTFNRRAGQYGPGVPSGGLPVVTFNDSLTFHLNGEQVQVIKLPNAHTDGDSMIHFKGSNVMHMGDVYRTTGYPYVDVRNGGNWRGILDALALALSLADDETKIIPGHGNVSNKGEMAAWHAMLVDIGDKVQSHVDAGDSLEATLTAKPSKKYNKRWGSETGFVTTTGFITMLYNQLSIDSR